MFRNGQLCMHFPHLFFSTDVPKRPVRPKWSRIFPSPFDDLMTTGFGDCSPVLLTTRASYDDLNSRMERPVSELRFRSNIIVRTDDGKPFAVSINARVTPE